MRNLAPSKSFRKRLVLFVRKHPELDARVERVFLFLKKDIFSPSINTHKLSGTLQGVYACSVNHEYRITFFFDDSMVYLLDIGSHDEVY